MAKHPFADQARAMMEANGIVFNSDGSTSIKRDQTQEQAQQKEQTQQQATPTKQTTQQGTTSDERDTLLAMQRQELEQLRSEKASWETKKTETQEKTQREQDLERELEELRGKIKDQTTQEQADAFRAMLEQQGFDSENLDDEVLLEIRDRFVKPMADKFERLEERLSQYESKFREPTAEETLEQVKQATNKKIVEAIPDFQTVFHSQAFQQRLAQKDNRFPTKTYGHALQIAYENGDHEFIVKEVKNFLNGGTAPNIGDIADVGATNGVGTTTQQQQAGDTFTYSDEEAIQMLRKRQMGDLSKQEYSEYRAKLDAHRSRS